jgi:hypothetical protein
MVDRIEMQLETVLSAGAIALHDQIRKLGRIRECDLESDVAVVACESRVNDLPKHVQKHVIRQLADIEFRPARVFETDANSSAISLLKAFQPVERVNHFLA